MIQPKKVAIEIPFHKPNSKILIIFAKYIHHI